MSRARCVPISQFWDLSLSLSRPPDGTLEVSLDDCFRQYTGSCTLRYDDMPKCAKCKTHRVSTKTIKIDRVPEVRWWLCVVRLSSLILTS